MRYARRFFLSVQGPLLISPPLNPCMPNPFTRPCFPSPAPLSSPLGCCCACCTRARHGCQLPSLPSAVSQHMPASLSLLVNPKVTPPAATNKQPNKVCLCSSSGSLLPAGLWHGFPPAVETPFQHRHSSGTLIPTSIREAMQSTSFDRENIPRAQNPRSITVSPLHHTQVSRSLQSVFNAY